jgi:Phosphatidylglycerophosphatase A and related proteins
LSKFVATFFYVGLLRPAPGTWGSIAGVISAYTFLQLTNFLVFCFLLIFFILIGFWTAKIYIEQNPEESDPSEVVIDEVIGQWIAVIPIGYIFQLEQNNNENLWFFWLWAFVSFRFFDM